MNAHDQLLTQLAELIEPLGPGGSGRYRRAAFDQPRVTRSNARQ
jgi:hypothetical protein